MPGSRDIVWKRSAMKSSLKYVLKNDITGESGSMPAMREYHASSAISVIAASTSGFAKAS
ncbi:MAG: hypothetical protein ACLTRJ_03145 [Bifidobacterium longum]|uniref:Uncharacterized protein n=1 Tax=Bifidobacterium longum subsp. longum TaxID=1679 RepID=A0A7L9UKD3_BIFLL|nr:hypothetical protein [Bifidobacterium longum]QOL54726.1 hypothetical protein BL5915_07895 [Bifidobacterium longum subsp. longum]UNL64481.1 hypothetical protein G8B15_06380 [Bifidobacterium longum subsp. longum]UNL70475.1 hypothetical protein G8B12_01900 [Bifidobacterium longum subsp. longum]